MKKVIELARVRVVEAAGVGHREGLDNIQLVG
jgi:hypothetical protein